jgi:hypothetical protein
VVTPGCSIMRAMERAVLVVDEILVTGGAGGHSCEGFRCHDLVWYWGYVASRRERNPVRELSGILSHTELRATTTTTTIKPLTMIDCTAPEAPISPDFCHDAPSRGTHTKGLTTVPPSPPGEGPSTTARYFAHEGTRISVARPEKINTE